MIQTIVTLAILYIATTVDLLVILLIFLLEQRLRKNIEYIFILVLLQT
jgi:cadmium resistance protein CadD (predicted permease)